MATRHNPKGPGGTWITGQRVPADGWYRDQYGVVVFFEKKSTFPPRVGFKTGGGVAYWEAYEKSVAADI